LEKAQSFCAFIHTPVLPQLTKKGKKTTRADGTFVPGARLSLRQKRHSNKPFID
jgi:hypothetical protein